MALAMTEATSQGTRSGVTLRELAQSLEGFAPLLTGNAETALRGVRQDSREVAPGDLFVARSGQRDDGARYVDAAIERGAVAVMRERGGPTTELRVPTLWVDDIARAFAFAAETIYGAPSRKLHLLGVTGTNGKTTTAFLVDQALAVLGQRSARIGTLGFAFAGREQAGSHTTPEADAISRRLADVVAARGSHCVMEVSSHAIALERVAALSFEVAAFSNLTQDHLDFHASMSAYAAAKARLFTELAPRASVLNVDDAFGRELATRARGRVLRVSQREPAEVRALSASLDIDGIRADVDVEGVRLSLESRLVGAHNLDNLLLALGMLVALGIPPQGAGQALSGVSGVPGRLERCDEPGDELLVVVDYAHTPDALTRVLAALRPLTRGRLVCVFGCGGDRDPGKRPLMGRAVAEHADLAIVTNDNPRTEAPEAIAEAVVRGLGEGEHPYLVELDRALAIERAIAGAAAGDTVLIAGKGHEDYQIFGAEKRPFDDRVQARQALARRRGGRHV
jgi:UDP-N-acetylmuramoyl-L-alanyl-D-glutamate--2,6-diaminopimelate ligase